MKLIDILQEMAINFEKYRKNYKEYANEIKEMALEHFGSNFMKLLVFGSMVKGNYRADSDIDIAIILRESMNEFERAKFVSLINKKFKLNPFEIHIISIDVWEKWYKNFVKSDFIEI